jgi:tRNA threonylcarbamoyladenosine biosynthesis protein TsaB
MAYQFNSNLNSEITKEGEVYSLCPMLDARRMEVYCMRLNSKLRIVEPTQAKIIDESSFIAWLEEHPVYFFGDGAEKCKAVVKHPNAYFRTGIIPSAAQLGELGFAKWKALQFEDTAAFEPLYLKDFMIKNQN